MLLIPRSIMSACPDPVPPASQTSAPAREGEATVGGTTRAVARNAFHLLLGQVGTTVLAILLAACLGRFLGAADFGLYYLLTSTSSFAYVLVEWGQSPYVIAEVARNRERAGPLLGTSLVLRVIGALVITAVACVALALLGYERRTCWLAALFIATFLPFFLVQGYAMIFRGFERMDLEASATVVNKVLVLGLTAAAFAVHGGLAGALIAQGIAGVGSLVLAAWLFKRLQVRHLGAQLENAKAILAGGTPIVATSLSNAASQYLEVVSLSKFALVETVGWYGAARNIFGTIVSIAAILGTAAFPGLSRAAGDTKEFRRELAAAMRPLLGIAALATVGSYLFADVGVGIVFGRAKFAQAALIIKANAPGQFLLFIDFLLGAATVALGRAKWLALVKALNILLAVGLYVTLIPLFQHRYGNGGIGVVIANGVAETAMLAAIVGIFPRGALAGSLLVDAGRALAASAGTLLLFRVLPRFTPVLGIPVCVIAFLGLAAAVGLIRRAELEGFRKLLLRRGKRRPERPA